MNVVSSSHAEHQAGRESLIQVLSQSWNSFDRGAEEDFVCTIPVSLLKELKIQTINLAQKHWSRAGS